ncbi:MAG: hypothetical protein M0038_14980 [Pseudomonadota bacterium]|nr:hypothetical protein [Pseudomonadota bacterium]
MERQSVRQSSFHLDALSSAVALNADFDLSAAVAASGLHRASAKALHGGGTTALA